VILNLLNSGILEGISTWSEERGMVESGEDSAEKEARRYWRDPVEAARDSSSCCSGDCAELRSLELDAPISRSRLLSSVLSPAIWKGRETRKNDWCLCGGKYRNTVCKGRRSIQSEC
jgi:hypothetical protein